MDRTQPRCDDSTVVRRHGACHLGVGMEVASADDFCWLLVEYWRWRDDKYWIDGGEGKCVRDEEARTSCSNVSVVSSQIGIKMQ